MHVRRIIGHIHRLAGLTMADHSLRTRHDAAAHGDLALVHGFSAPVSDHVAIDIDELAALGWQQDRHQPGRGLDALELAEKLTQRRSLIAAANERLKRMLLSIEGAEAFNPSQSGQNQGCKATPKGGIAVMQQGKVFVRMATLMVADSLFEPGHHRCKGLSLLEPASKQMHPHKGQTRGDIDHGAATPHGDISGRATGAALAPAPVPLGPPSVDLAQRHPRPHLMLGGSGEHVSAGATRLLLEQGPKHRLLDFSVCSTVTKRWTWLRSQGRLTQGD